MLISQALRIGPKEVIALAGGGGKTALMFRLAGELSAAGRQTITTMTTRIFVSQMQRAPLALIADDETALLAALPEALARSRHVLVAGGVIVEADKAAGVPPDLLDRLIALPFVDTIIIEADGSRRLPFKAPAEHEPVIPAGATLVVPMAGMEALGRPLGPEIVHRPERVAALTGAYPGDPITPEMIARVLSHPEGGGRNAPAGARLIPFLNKVEDDATFAGAREVARLALAHRRVDSVAIGALEGAEPVREVWGRVGAVVLAAGAASRYGALKQVLPWGDRALVAHVTEQALSCADVDRVAVTAGAGADEVEAALASLPVEIVPVPDWADGQSRSVRAGLAALVSTGPAPGPALSAVLFLLADQPGVSPALLSALVGRHRETLAPIVAPRYQGRRGNPVLFDRSTFGEFAALEGDTGARSIIQSHDGEIAWVDWEGSEITEDIDTAEDYRPPGDKR